MEFKGDQDKISEISFKRIFRHRVSYFPQKVIHSFLPKVANELQVILETIFLSQENTTMMILPFISHHGYGLMFLAHRGLVLGQLTRSPSEHEYLSSNLQIYVKAENCESKFQFFRKLNFFCDTLDQFIFTSSVTYQSKSSFSIKKKVKQITL